MVADPNLPIDLIVGDLTVTLDGIDLRDIRHRSTEVVRRVYPVFQDRNWTNRPWRIASRDITQIEDGWRVTGSGTGSFDAAHLDWEVQATITSTAVDYRFQATAREPFLRNRLGLCLLHPMSVSGLPCTVLQTDDGVVESQFPRDLSPHQPFIDMRQISHRTPDALVTVSFTGEVFEMEDHRNWSDASYKTYCTPITEPFPVEVQPGDAIVQSIVISIAKSGQQRSETAARPWSDSTTPGDPSAAPVVIDVTDARYPRPGVGLSLPKGQPTLAPAGAAALRTLNLDHLRVELNLNDGTAASTLLEAVTSARRAGTRLRVAAFARGIEDLQALADMADGVEGARDLVDCWYVFSDHDKVTPGEWGHHARLALGPEAVVGGGTNLYYTELNREHPDSARFDVINFSMNPQVHAFDDRTLIQNALTQQLIAEDSWRLSGGKSVSVSPITLRPRFNPNATDPESDVSNTHLPSHVDARQDTSFAAAWLATSLKYLSEARTIDTVTYFDTDGSTGVMDDLEPFPVFDVLAAIAGCPDAVTCSSSEPEQVDALIVAGQDGVRALLANYSSVDRAVRLQGPAMPEPLDATALASSVTVIPITQHFHH
jgi:D-apionolactonase